MRAWLTRPIDSAGLRALSLVVRKGDATPGIANQKFLIDNYDDVW